MIVHGGAAGGDGRWLENSGHRVVWVVRNPPADDKTNTQPVEPDLDALLPQGFLSFKSLITCNVIFTSLQWLN